MSPANRSQLMARRGVGIMFMGLVFWLAGGLFFLVSPEIEKLDSPKAAVKAAPISPPEKSAPETQQPDWI